MEHLKYDSEDDRFHIDLTGQIRMEMAGMVDSPAGWTGKVHCHPFWELVFIHAGIGAIKIGNTSLPFVKADLFLIPPLEIHQFVNAGSGTAQLVYIGFGTDSKALGHYDADVAPVLKLDAARDLLLEKLRQMAASIKSAKSGERVYQDQALLFEIIYRLLAFIKDHPPATHDFTADRNGLIADRAKRFLDSNIHRTVKVDEVASKFFLSPHYFAKKFRDEVGCTIKEYHNRIRMERALELLKDPALGISQIAAKLGFDHVTYFTNRFREFHGHSPSNARSRNLPYEDNRPGG